MDPIQYTIQYMGTKNPKTCDHISQNLQENRNEGNEIDEKMSFMRKWENVAKGIRKCR